MSMSMPDCYRCKHFRGASPDDPPTCAAFPEEIPEEIFVGLRTSADSDARTRVRHTSPYPGDHGIMFEAATAQRDIVADEPDLSQVREIDPLTGEAPQAAGVAG